MYYCKKLFITIIVYRATYFIFFSLLCSVRRWDWIVVGSGNLRCRELEIGRGGFEGMEHCGE